MSAGEGSAAGRSRRLPLAEQPQYLFVSSEGANAARARGVALLPVESRQPEDIAVERAVVREQSAQSVPVAREQRATQPLHPTLISTAELVRSDCSADGAGLQSGLWKVGSAIVEILCD